ncbi:MAG: lytic transglycosylase domain-containing protein [Solirubrobacterales bacterium]
MVKRGPARFRFSIILWLFIILILVVVFTFPRWIVSFYPMPHREIVMKYAGEYDVDPYLVFALIRVESKFESEATSPVGARGLMQLMPETARWAAKQMAIPKFSDQMLTDPEINIRIGCWLLADLNREFQGRTPLVIAAYNAGRGNVREWLVNGIWDGRLETVRQIPFQETQNHVQRVINDYKLYLTIYDTERTP